MKSLIIGIGIAIVILATSFVSETPSTVRSPIGNSTPTLSEKEIAIEKAKKLFKEKKLAGIVMTDGPCLSEEIIPDWCVDVAYFPRKTVDDDPANQCQSLLGQKTHHVVELDTEGNLIRAL